MIEGAIGVHPLSFKGFQEKLCKVENTYQCVPYLTYPEYVLYNEKGAYAYPAVPYLVDFNVLQSKGHSLMKTWSTSYQT